MTCFNSDEFTILGIIRAIIGGTAVILTLFIGLIAVKEFRKLKKLNKWLKYLFYVSIISVIIRSFCVIFADNTCICNGIRMLAYCFLLLSLLGTLLIRLQTMFANSVYAITTKKLATYTIFYILISVVFIASVVMNIIAHIAKNKTENANVHSAFAWNTLILAVGMLLYVIAGILAVMEFSKNLMNLTKTQTNSFKNVNQIELNQSQQKLINQIAKYNALFSLASLTSVIVIIVMFISSVMISSTNTGYWIIAMVHILTTFDSVINIICLFLQYSFANKCYSKYCNCLDVSWKRIINKQITESIKNEHLATTEIQKLTSQSTDTTTKIVNESDSEI
eukprot:146737_1